MLDVAERSKTLSEIIEDLCSEHPDNTHAAADALHVLILTDRALRDELTQPFLKNACYERVALVVRIGNRKRWGGESAPATGPAQGVDRRAGATLARSIQDYAVRLLDYRLPVRGGVRMRNATVADLRAAAEFQRSQGRTMLQIGAWFDSVADALDKTKKATVGDALSDKQLEKLKQAAKAV